MPAGESDTALATWPIHQEGRQIPKEALVSSVLTAPAEVARVVAPTPLSNNRVLLLVSLTVFVALAAYYFIGVDEGMTSVFGKTLVIHEWVHDSRHFLGFPCH